MSQRRFADTDWVDGLSPIARQTRDRIVSSRPAPTLTLERDNDQSTVRDSSLDLAAGCQVLEMNTVPAEFLDLFDDSRFSNLSL